MATVAEVRYPEVISLALWRLSGSGQFPLMERCLNFNEIIDLALLYGSRWMTSNDNIIKLSHLCVQEIESKLVIAEKPK